MVRDKREAFLLLFYVVVVFLVLNLNSYAFAWSGQVFDKETGEPIRGASIVRTWTKVTAGPYGASYSNYSVKETKSDSKGKFSLAGTVPVIFPIVQSVSEDKAVVFKAGYQFAILEGHPKKIELVPVAALFQQRTQVLTAIDDSHIWSDKYKAKLFLKSIQQEREFIDLLKNVEKTFLPQRRASRQAWLSLTRRTPATMKVPSYPHNAQAVQPGFSTEWNSSSQILKPENPVVFNRQSKAGSITDAISLLEDKKSSTGELLSALQMVKEQQIKDAIPCVRNLLYGQDYLVSSMAISVLQSFGQKFTEDEVNHFIRALYSEKQSIRSKGLGLLRKIGDDSVPYLTEVFQSDNDTAKHMSIEALALINTPAASRAIIDAYYHVSKRTQLRIIPIFRELHEPEVFAILTDILQTGDLDLQERAITSLGYLGDARAVKPISAKLYTDNRTLQRLAIEALGRVDDETSLNELKQFLHDKHNRRFTLEAISNFKSEETAAFLIDYMKTIPENDISYASRALSAIGAPAFSPIMDNIPNENEKIYSALIGSLGQTGDRRVTQILLNKLQDERSKIRKKICHVLAVIKDPQAIEPLFFTMADDDTEVRQAAANALVAIGNPCLPALMEGLKNDDPYLRWRAAWCLAKIKDKGAFVPLVSSLADRSPEVRWNAAFALGNMGEVRAIEPLKNLLHDRDKGVVNMANMMISEIKERAEHEEVIRQRRKLKGVE